MLLKNKKLSQAALFYAISLGLATALAVYSPIFGPGVLLVTMFTPAISVAICRTVSPEGQRFRLTELGLSRLGLRFWPFALIVPIVALLPGYLLVWGSGIANLAGMSGEVNPVQVIVSFVISIIFGAAIGALGEEIGWRGYLLPRLIDTIGIGPAGLLTGFLHGLWHVPLILFTPYYLADAPTLVVVPLFLSLMTLSGPIYAYLRVASGSIVPVALMHHAWNGYWETLDSITTSTCDACVLYLSGESGLVSILILAAICLWLARRRHVDRTLVSAI